MNSQTTNVSRNVFCFTPKGAVIKLPKNATTIDFAVHTKIGDSAIGCNINEENPLTNWTKQWDMIEIMTSKMRLHHCITILIKTEKARASIRRYWQDKSLEILNLKKNLH